MMFNVNFLELGPNVQNPDLCPIFRKFTQIPTQGPKRRKTQTYG